MQQITIMRYAGMASGITSAKKRRHMSVHIPTQIWLQMHC